jgi:dTDP-4-dehydrorhamnose 3,5-epimerase
MDFRPTRLPEVMVVIPRVFRDERGYFLETWRRDKFAAAGIAVDFVQDNHSHSVRHTLRGLHYQIARPQGKLLRVTSGEVLDVAVDVRRSSPRFGQWVSVVLSDANQQMLWVPPGFAHGYLCLSEHADLLYKCTDLYSPEHERAIRWNDANIGVQWALPPGVVPILSAKDAAAPFLAEAEYFE